MSTHHQPANDAATPNTSPISSLAEHPVKLIDSLNTQCVSYTPGGLWITTMKKKESSFINTCPWSTTKVSSINKSNNSMNNHDYIWKHKTNNNPVLFYLMHKVPCKHKIHLIIILVFRKKWDDMFQTKEAVSSVQMIFYIIYLSPVWSVMLYVYCLIVLCINLIWFNFSFSI